MDLYYLMDLSYSMKDDKQTIEKLGERIGKFITCNIKDVTDLY